LSLTDPSGHLSTHESGMTFSALITLGAASGINGAVNAGALTTTEGYVWAGTLGAMSGAAQSNSLKGAVWGAFSAVAFHGVGSYFESAEWAQRGAHVLGTSFNAGGLAAKALAHGVLGGSLQHLQAGSFGSGFASAGLSELSSGAVNGIDPANPALGLALRTTVSGLIGGTVTQITGGKFATGFVTAAFARAFNEELEISPGTADARLRAITREFRAKTDGLSDFRWGSADSAATVFADMAQPLSNKYGIELGDHTKSQSP
jgi:hypothetical protein